MLPVLLSMLQHPLAWLGLSAVLWWPGESRGCPLFGVSLLLGTGPVHGVELYPKEHEEEVGGHQGWKRRHLIHSWRGHSFPMTLALLTYGKVKQGPVWFQCWMLGDGADFSWRKEVPCFQGDPSGTHPLQPGCWYSPSPSIARPWDILASLGWLCTWGLAS